jgi:hypothetical protein
MELRWAMSFDLNMSRELLKYLLIRRDSHSEYATGIRCDENYGHAVVHRKKTNRIHYHAKR